MKILVTGSNGFIGSHICNKLKYKYEIIGLGTSPTSIVSGIEYISADLSEEGVYKKIADKIVTCDIIIHLSAVIDKNNYSKKLIDVNCFGAMNIYELARILKVNKIIHFSGSTVIGIPKIIPIREDHPANPISAYHATKLFAEYILNLLCYESINVINLRIPSPIGVGMNKNTIIPVFLEKAINNKGISLLGKGGRRQNYIDVRDISDFVEIVILKGITGTYNLASNKTISNLELAKLCLNLTNSSSKVAFLENEDPEEFFDWNIDISKSRIDFGFEPKYTLTDSIKNILDSK